jgi:hypothetical protein
MNKNIFLSGILILASVLSGCATRATVSSDYDRATDFSKLKTYTWVNHQNLSGDLRFDDPDLRAAIQESVETDLQAKGLQRSAAGQPDLFLKYYITVKQKEEYIGGNYPPPLKSNGAWTGGINTGNYAAQGMATTFKYDDGTFVLDMMDPRSGGIVWRGSLQGMVDPAATREKRIARAPAAVAKVLKNFPPGKK